MTYANPSYIGTGSAPTGILETIGKFLNAWSETFTAYTNYVELSTLGNADLAARGLRRQDVARFAMGLPLVPRQ